MAVTSPPVRAADPSWDQPGGLGIKERRAWATWQVAAAVVLVAVIGFVVGHSGGPTGKTGVRTLITMPPPEGGPPATTATAASGAPAAAGATAPTTVAAAPAAASGPAVLLLPNVQGTGPKVLPAFSAGGEWKIGWAYRCVLAPGGTGTFRIVVVPEGGPPNSTPAVDQNGRQSTGVATVATTGRQHLEVNADAACAWAVKVSGPAG